MSKPEKVYIRVPLPPEVKVRLAQLAERERRRINEMAGLVLEHHLGAMDENGVVNLEALRESNLVPVGG